MAKAKVEVCETREQAAQRVLILKQKGWTVGEPEVMEGVYWANLCPGGATDSGTDADGQVWLVLARK